MPNHYDFLRNRSKILSVLAGLTGFATAAQANEIQVNFSLAAGATSASIPIPGVNTPVSLTCATQGKPFPGVGRATLLRNSSDATIQWVSLDMAKKAISTGFPSTTGALIVWCSFTGNQIDMQVGGTEGTIRVQNQSGTAATGVINFVW